MVRLVFLLIFLATFPGYAQKDSFPSYLNQASSSDIDGGTSAIPELGVAIEPFQPNPISFPGLVQRLWSMDFANHSTIDVRVVPRAALFVPEEESASPFLPPGPFGFEMEGVLQFEDRMHYEIRAEGTGQARIEVHGELAFEATGENLAEGTVHRLLFEEGAHPIRIRYQSPKEGDSVFRLLWSAETFSEEPVSSEWLFHDFVAEDLKRANLIRLGRDSVAKYRCFECHRWEGLGLTDRMPELDRDAPDFEDIGTRYHHEWIVNKILKPHSTGIDREMPSLLHPQTRMAATEEARLIAAYLESLGSAETAESLSDSTQESEGKRLFAEQNCNACHVAPVEDPLEEEDRPLFEDLSQKWRRPALVGFLENPARHHAWIRMPDFGLSRSEAEALAAYLMPSADRSGYPHATPEEIERGRALVDENLCLQCHALSRWETAPPPSVEWKVSDQGCLAASPELQSEAPNLHLARGEREGLLLFLENGLDSLNRSVPSEFAQRQMARLQCLNCHQGKVEKVEEPVGWDNFISLGALLNEKKDSSEDTEEDLADEEEFEDFDEDFADVPSEATASEHQVLPTLVWAGEKLQTQYLHDLFHGDLPEKTRHLLPARMPAFRPVAKMLSIGLTRLHGLDEGERGGRPQKPEDSEIGERLLLDPPGLNCIACHPVGDRSATSGDQGSSINLKWAPDRLRRPFFERLLRNPRRVLPGTPMPQFLYEGDRSPAETFYEGDGSKQLEAIWNYLVSLQQSP